MHSGRLVCCCLAQRNKIYQTLAKQTIPTGWRMKPLLVSKEGNATKLLITARDFLWFPDINHTLSKRNGLQSDSLFLPGLEVTVSFFFFFFFFLQMTNVFVLFAFSQPSDTNGC